MSAKEVRAEWKAYGELSQKGSSDEPEHLIYSIGSGQEVKPGAMIFMLEGRWLADWAPRIAHRLAAAWRIEHRARRRVGK